MEVLEALALGVARQKSVFERGVGGVPVPQEMHEIQQIGVAKRAVAEAQQALQIRILVLGDELVGRVVHQRQQLGAFADDGRALPPGQQRGKEAANLNVGPLGEAVGDLDGVGGDELGAVVVGEALGEEALHGAEIGHKKR